MVNTRRPCHPDMTRVALILSSRHEHVLEEIMPAAPDNNVGEVNGPQLVTRYDLEQMAAQINKNLEESLRAIVLNNAGEVGKRRNTPRCSP